MASVEHLSDSEIRQKLAEYGCPDLPVTDTTRNILLKKLKRLMVQAGSSGVKIGTKSSWNLSRFSSAEEESENEDTATIRKTSAMPPPSSSITRATRRKSTGRLSDPPTSRAIPRRVNEINLRQDLFAPKPINTSDTAGIRTNFGSSTSNFRTNRSYTSSQDDFDTGSDSDVPVDRGPHRRYTMGGTSVTESSSDREPHTTSSYTSYTTTTTRSRYLDSTDNNGNRGGASERSGSLFKSSLSDTATSSTANQPFQSSFVRRLSGMTGSKTNRVTSTPRVLSTSPASIFDVKESDISDVGSPNGIYGSMSNSQHGSKIHSKRDIFQEFKTTEDEVKFWRNSQIVSMVLVIVAALFFVVLGVMYLNMRTLDPVNFGLNDEGNNFPICGSDFQRSVTTKHDESAEILCLESTDLERTIRLLRVVHPEAMQRAIAERCGTSDKSLPARMTHQETIKWLLHQDPHMNGLELERLLRALKILLMVNPQWGISVIDPTGMAGITGSKYNSLINNGALEVMDPDIPITCYLLEKVYAVLYALIFIVVVFALLYALLTFGRWYRHRRVNDKNEVYKMVDRIIDVLVTHHQASPTQPFIPINHVRDQLIPPPDRKRLAKIWDKAVQWLSKSDSRVRCEVQTVAGEEFPVWRWLPSTASSPARNITLSAQGERRGNNKVWQGQAFETMAGSPNSLPCSPTPCLKIRHMFDPDVEYGEEWPVRVQDAILEKCGEEGVSVLHVAVDRASREGCVYLKCASQEDAGKAYRALHGWWFDSNLVTVKYLRLERYHERFPDAVRATVAMHPSNNQKLSLQAGHFWQSPLETN